MRIEGFAAVHILFENSAYFILSEFDYTKPFPCK